MKPQLVWVCSDCGDIQRAEPDDYCREADCQGFDTYRPAALIPLDVKP